MYEDMPQRKCGMFLWNFYGDQPAGWNIAGPKKTVKTFKRNDFVAYRNTHYLAPATSLVIAGGFNEKDVVKKLKVIFQNWNVETREQKESERHSSKARGKLFVKNQTRRIS